MLGACMTIRRRLERIKSLILSITPLPHLAPFCQTSSHIYPRYDPDKIVARAESVLKKEQEGKFKSYHILKQNCEHFATWCVVGEGESFQVQGLREKIASAVQKLFGVGSKIAKGILRLLFISADEIASGLSKAAPEIVLGGTAALYLIYCIVMTALHVRDYNNSQICWSCLKGKLQDLWLSFGAFGVTSALTFIILHFAIPLIAPGIGIPLMILLILLSLAFQWSVPKIRKALQGPFTVDKQKNTSLADIKVGDVVTFKFGPTKIVTDVKFENDTPNKGVIRVVHYVIPSLLQKKIVEEYFHVDLAKKSIYVFDCTPLRTYSTDMVVSRARSRIGETKWKMFSNRSDHFCYWAKIQDDSDSIEEELDQNPSETESKKLSSVFVDKTEIHLMDEIRVGDVIESSEIGFFRDTGIVVAIQHSDQDNDRKIRIDVCVYDFSWTVRKKTIEINLNEDRIYVKKYHPAHCHPKATRARKARGLIDKEGIWWTSTGFIEHCIMRNPE